LKNILAEDYMDEFVHRQKQPINAVPTHLPTLNKICRDDGGSRGIAKGWFVTVGGNPGHGKSAFALNLCSSALEEGEQIGYISLEMSSQQLATRLYSIHTGTEIRLLERGGFDDTAWGATKMKLQDLPAVWVPENVLSTWKDVVEFVKNCHSEGVTWFCLDYLQLVQRGTEAQLNEAIGAITSELRAWGVNNKSTIVCLSQFNRVTSTNYDETPRPSGLYGGMLLEASSDVCVLLDHSKYKRKLNYATTEISIGKNRHGPTLSIPVEWDYKNLTMREIEAPVQNSYAVPSKSGKSQW
jgi:replicative DNA helicase